MWTSFFPLPLRAPTGRKGTQRGAWSAAEGTHSYGTGARTAECGGLALIELQPLETQEEARTADRSEESLEYREFGVFSARYSCQTAWEYEGIGSLGRTG